MSQRHPNAMIFKAEVDHRLGNIRAYLEDFQRGKATSFTTPLWNLRALQDGSRQAGYRDLSAVCELMESQIMALQSGRYESPNTLVEQIILAGEYIRQRAHAVVQEPDIPVAEPRERVMEACLV